MWKDISKTDLPNCTEAMPPQEDIKSPVPFITGGHGEWSDTTKSMLPDFKWSHKRSFYFWKEKGMIEG